MEADLEVIWHFTQQRVLVIGDVMLDSYLDGTAERLCREAPVPVIRTQTVRHLPGGAANAAVNARALGARVMLVGLVGSDAASLHLRAALRERGIDDGWLVEHRALSTLQKLRVRAAGQLLVRIDDGCTEPDPESQQQLIDQILNGLTNCDAVILSDYGYGVLSDPVLQRISEVLRFRPCPIVIDTKLPHRFAHVPATVVTPSHLDLQRTASDDLGHDLTAIEQRGRLLLKQLRASYLAITLAHNGVLLLNQDGQAQHYRARAVTATSSIGAGDVFTATLALGLAAGASCEQAVRLGMLAAELAIRRADTVTIDRPTLLRAFCQPEHRPQLPGPLSVRAAQAWVETARESGRRITLLAGSFAQIGWDDVRALRQYVEPDSTLLAAVWSDEALAQRTGTPVSHASELDRATLAAALLPVDTVVVCPEPSAATLLRTLRPHRFIVPASWPSSLHDWDEQRVVNELGILVVRLPQPRVPQHAPKSSTIVEGNGV